MAGLRRWVGRVTMVWVLCQAASMSLATATLWPGPLPSRLECTCTHTDHGACPMHHGRSASRTRCAIGAAAQVPSAALTSVLDMGLLRDQVPLSAEPMARPRQPVVVSARSLRPQPPDPPPPRA